MLRSPIKVSVRLLGSSEAHILENVAPGVFDHAVDPALAREFLSDPRHHLAVAITSGGQVVGMASGVNYVHPDKPAQLFINEVGVSAGYEGMGIGTQLLNTLIERARELGCVEAWVATEPGNATAQALYTKTGGNKESEPFIMFTFPLQAQRDGGQADED